MSIDYQIYFTIVEEGETKGEISLNENYRADAVENDEHPEFAGNGSKLPLPDVLVIPDQIGTTEVTSLAPGMFYRNDRVREIVLPTTIREIPAYFCANAINLRTVNGMERITSIGKGAFGCTRIKNALFPNLETMGSFAFTGCGYLRNADIGTVSVIPKKAFANCALLNKVIHKEDEEAKVSIGTDAFRNTRSLRELPLLAYVNKVEDGAFFGSRISTSVPTEGLLGTRAFPTFDNKADFWTGVTFTPCCNRIVTKFSQNNASWADQTFLLDTWGPEEEYKYPKSCAMFAVMHIHSAITGNNYPQPNDFMTELERNGLSEFRYYNNWPGQFHNVARMFEALGYRTEVHGADSDLSREDYKAMVDELTQGAYIYAQISGTSSWNGNWNVTEPDGGHAVVIYGINDLGEVCVLDSNVLHEHFYDVGYEEDVDIYTYTIPYQNIAGSSSNFVIVYPNGFTVTTRPSELPASVNATVITTNSEVEKLPEGKEGCLTSYNLSSNPADAIEEWQPNGSSKKYVRHALDTENWSIWYVVASTI